MVFGKYWMKNMKISSKESEKHQQIGQCKLNGDTVLFTLPAVMYAALYILIPTSNHNLLPIGTRFPTVVYLLNPTSNHNCCLVVYN